MNAIDKGKVKDKDKDKDNQPCGSADQDTHPQPSNKRARPEEPGDDNFDEFFGAESGNPFTDENRQASTA